jgi:hypothetical protein
MYRPFFAALATITTRLIVQTLVLLVILGLCLYLVETYVPMSPPIRVVLRVVVVLLLCLWLLTAFGVI